MSDADEKPELRPFTFRTAGYDARFPNTNQSKHCFQNYVDHHKCVNQRGKDFEPCKHFFKAYHALCPNEWHQNWDTLRENGNFPTDLE
ncbi:cytochrome c oxidase, subunit VIb [Protomyces lactucae-debilis]|uniref:Cytochrome c oxidase subunit n=1 Tax=Protomyces lactucae-debilis TaxID=2754530 RepID=A0A1Y2FD80_PROLT|nr:cytochrome c oxidase, subunit VIb [Protomyces lactucae-debilis]ORY80805.1 cytochrome c oxidase, subunit VIb [Protomyces lactucae-debilis]